MRDFVNERAKSIKPSGIRKFFDVVSEMQDAISLGIGEPDFVTPWEYSDAAIRSLRSGHTHYTGNRGDLELRKNIARYLKERFDIEYEENRMVVTIGASEAIDATLRAVCEKGDEVLIPDPSYVSYAPCVELSDGTPVAVPCKQENGFIMTPEQLEKVITPKTKAIILAYPNNPTGGIMTKEQLEAIAPVIVKHDLLIISDEIYAELSYGETHYSPARIPALRKRTVLINGFSKAFAMTGWRIGYVCSPNKELDTAIFKIHQYGIMCAPTMAQAAANYALKMGFEDGFSSVSQMREEYDRRRRFIVNALNQMGLTCFEPKGAFYVFPSVKSTGMNGEEFATQLLKEGKVAVVPGSAFGKAGEYHVRCSYATSMTQLTEAMDRIARFLQSLHS